MRSLPKSAWTCAVMLAAASLTWTFVSPRAQAGDEADEKLTVYPLAVFPFAERGRDAKELGAQVTDLMFVNLVTDINLYLVDREDLKKIQDELELNLSGLANPNEATKVGNLTGAKILVTGSVLQVGDSLYLVAKIIGTETSRVLGASVKGSSRDDLDALVVKLAEQVADTVKKRAGDLVAKPVSRADRLAALKKSLGKGKRPKVYVDIPERHIGQATIDPAAETEVTQFCIESGFEVIDPEEGEKSEADILLLGEAFSERASQHGNLISVKARLELKAVDRKSGRVLATDRHTSVAVDLAEQIAGKTALQEAGATLAERILPSLVKPGKKKDK